MQRYKFYPNSQNVLIIVTFMSPGFFINLVNIMSVNFPDRPDPYIIGISWITMNSYGITTNN